MDRELRVLDGDAGFRSGLHNGLATTWKAQQGDPTHTIADGVAGPFPIPAVPADPLAVADHVPRVEEMWRPGHGISIRPVDKNYIYFIITFEARGHACMIISKPS